MRLLAGNVEGWDKVLVKFGMVGGIASTRELIRAMSEARIEPPAARQKVESCTMRTRSLRGE